MTDETDLETEIITQEDIARFLVLKQRFQYTEKNLDETKISGGAITGFFNLDEIKITPELRQFCKKKDGSKGPGLQCELPPDKRAKCVFTNTVKLIIPTGGAAPMKRVIDTKIKCELQEM